MRQIRVYCRQQWRLTDRWQPEVSLYRIEAGEAESSWKTRGELVSSLDYLGSYLPVGPSCSRRCWSSAGRSSFSLVSSSEANPFMPQPTMCEVFSSTRCGPTLGLSCDDDSYSAQEVRRTRESRGGRRPPRFLFLLRLRRTCSSTSTGASSPGSTHPSSGESGLHDFLGRYSRAVRESAGFPGKAH
jgi:hypothetical protein